MDFSKFELSDELRAALEKEYSDSVAGLKGKNSDLIGRLDKQKQEYEASILEQTQAQEDIKVSLAEKEGDIEKYKAAVAEREEALAATKREFQEATNERIKTEALSEFSVALTDDPAGRMYMQKQFTDSIDIVDGEIKPKDVTKSLEDLKRSLVSDEVNARYIKANVGSGAGSAGSDGRGSAIPSGKQVSEMSKSEKLAYYESKM